MAYDNYLNLTNEVMSKIGITDDDVTTVAKQALNDIMQEICQAKNFSWLYGDSSFITSAPYRTGLATASTGSTAVTGTGTTWYAGMVGMKFSCEDATYIISAVGGVGALTLSTAYAGAGGVGTLTYTIYQDEYSLSSEVEDVISMRQQDSVVRLENISAEVMDYYWPTRAVFGYPVKYTNIGYDASGYYKVALYPIPAYAHNIYYRYKKRVTEMSGDTDVPIIPLRYRWVLAKGALYTVAKYLDMPDIGKDFEREYIQGKAQIMGADKRQDERIIKGSGADDWEATILEL